MESLPFVGTILDLAHYFDQFPYYKQSGWTHPSSGENAIPYLGLTLAFFVFVFALELYLDYRQLNKFKSAKEVPKVLQNYCTTQKKIMKDGKETTVGEVFTKSNAYNIDKFEFNIMEKLLVQLIEGVALMLVGYLPFCWVTAGSWADSVRLAIWKTTDAGSDLSKEILQTIMFVVITTLHDTIVGLPFSLYSTFVVEHKHGFNKSTLGLYFSDKIKSLLLTFVIGSPIIACIVWLVRWGGPYFYFYVWAFLCVVSIIMMTIFPIYIAPLFNKYEPFGDLPEEKETFEAIKELAQKVKFPLTKIFKMDGSRRSNHSNAFFYGWFNNKRVVLYDTLIKQVEKSELLAILLHEFGHWKLGHTLQGFFIMQLYTFFMFLSFSYVQNSSSLFSAFGFSSSEKQMPVFVGLLLFTYTFMTPVEKVLALMLNFNSRYNEFSADNFAVSHGMGDQLASGLFKISIENLSNFVPDRLYSAYHFSHPPLVERLNNVKKGGKKD